VLSGDRVVLNLGTHATIPDVPGLAAAKPLTNVEALELDRLPDHLVVIGGAKPAALDYVTAAGLPVVAVTARIEPGQAISVRGAAGSVGACATQMAKEADASVYGAARPRDVERVRALGAEPIVGGDGVSAHLASRSLDAIIDTIGGDALESTGEALRPNGIIVSVVRAPNEAYVRLKGVRAAYFIVDVTRDRLDRISTMVERGTLDLPIGEVLDLADASTAHRMLGGAPHKPGKIVLKVAD
jgi:NADPH:quinone reductase-like Zn-dependent oxidoreductase